MRTVCLLLLGAAVGLVPAAGVSAQPGKGKNWKGKDLEKRDLRQENLEGAVLDDAKMFLTNLKDVKAAGASFRDADLTSASLDGADLTGADFRDATLAKASFQTAVLAKANLSGLDLSETSLQRADLRGANLRNIKALGDITRADLRDADLRGANLLGAKDYAAPSAKFKGAKYDKNTKWFKGFDLENSGAVLTETDPDPVAKADPPTAAAPVPQPDPKKEPAEVEGPKGAPPAKEVKAQLEKKMWGPPATGGVTHTYDYKTFKFGEPRKGDFKTDGIPANRETVVYPVRVVVEVTRTFNDGTSKKEEKKQTYVFFKDEFGDWTFRFKSND
ncbi:Uncharacterized protein OS=Corynebacterium falsenii DSM 44353 GN=CFAL_11965 PE=4 SV=1: Pentapeptide_4: Pentapeptide [Gemmataceae bacterium]|jgi:uncharacterized protein YjbI with pentapeptide repeats|nr:Uncharacterized protein OS=Corynebacterium falsenii DSM 44353 GN=CFAL_11965 PE=4 SV=1: Pentapeptide_4: Pentapeptide [Gemmataceae bacterium]VTT98605.1 Uncharacterized protein OS=Corynebacterium falsenii DSM 44353 GN=CFAL_11965 PE=4 SV=1: Pentapeptide_4: Pentapeptide [Gemmataceae bacterium]